MPERSVDMKYEYTVKLNGRKYFPGEEVPVEGQTVTMQTDMVIVAVGVSPNPIIPRSMPELEVSKRGTIVVDDNLRSSIPVLYAGGDIVRGGATVILAMSDGRKAAAAMHSRLAK